MNNITGILMMLLWASGNRNNPYWYQD